ncbi:hypothetical protein [Sphingomonas faeni]|uniref:hypothetical protein n=1 Tax=Sphingomonas faeni TaxID=185950 RepID=UPI0033569724
MTASATGANSRMRGGWAVTQLEVDIGVDRVCVAECVDRFDIPGSGTVGFKQAD